MGATGAYIYGIAGSRQEHKLKGVEHVYTVPFRDISAVIADTEILDYAYLDRDSLARLIIKHQEVVEKVMSEYPVIPMKLGTYTENRDEVEKVLRQGYTTIVDTFNKIDNKIETDVVVLWNDLKEMLKKIGDMERIREAKDRLLADPEGITVEDQMKFGFLMKKELDAIGQAYAGRIREELEKACSELRTHELMNDKMIFNAAFLIGKNVEHLFEKKIEFLNAEMGSNLNFQCIGPLPPYSFYTLEVKKIRREEIEQARERLRLDKIASRDEVKKAYQRAALLSHPDRNINATGTERMFDEDTKAYRMLIEYINACEQSGVPAHQGHPAKDMFLIGVKE